MKLTANIYLDELVPKVFYGKLKDQCIWFIDPRLPVLIQTIRDFIGKPVIINDWNIGGKLEMCGFRPPDTTTGAPLSQHRFGRAADMHFTDVSPEEVREILRKNFSKFQPLGLSTIENNTPTWTHIDMRTTGLPTLFEVPYVIFN